MKKILLIIIGIQSLLIFGQDNSLDLLVDFDESELFGFSEDQAVEVVESEENLELVLEDQPFLWGGKIHSELVSSWMWDQEPLGINSWSDQSLWDPQFGLELFFDARPEPGYRVFGKAKAMYPFDEEKGEDLFSLYELFADFNWNNSLYFRMGKQNINWSVGYLFSPADILNLTPINPVEYGAEREGPLALKMQLPLGVNNLTLYTVAEDIDYPQDITWAPKGELLIGNWEMGLGAVLNPQLSPKAAFFLTGPLAGIDLFAEALLQYGSDRLFIVEMSPFPVMEERNDIWFLTATAGFLYREESSRTIFLGQYWFDGEAQSLDDPALRGHHFSGVSIQKTWVLNSENPRSAKINLSLLWLGDLTDKSGLFTPEVEWELTDHAAFAINGSWYYGSDTSYYRFRGGDTAASPAQISLLCRLGYGSF